MAAKSVHSIEHSLGGGGGRHKMVQLVEHRLHVAQILLAEEVGEHLRGLEVVAAKHW